MNLLEEIYRNFLVGDLVYVVFRNLLRANWLLRRILKVVFGSDKVICVAIGESEGITRD